MTMAVARDRACQPGVSAIRVGDGRRSVGQEQQRGRLRVLHVFDRLQMGGTEKVAVKLLSCLDPRLFEHSICTLRGVDDVSSWAGDVDVLNAGAGSAHFQFNILRLAGVMKAVRPDIVHSRNWGGIEAIPAARLAKVPVIIHSEHGYELGMSQGLPLRQRFLRYLAYRWTTAVVAVSHELRQYHAAQAWWQQDSIRVVYNGVDEARFKPDSMVRVHVRQALGLPANAVVIGFVGRMIALKDVMTLLRAGEIISQGRGDIYYLLVGSGPELARLREYAAVAPLLNGRVIFPGASDKVPDLLNAMDVFVLPSLMEGMSNTLLEALATGIPVVATRVGGNPEVIAESVCGYLYEPGNFRELSDRLLSLYQDHARRAEFGKAARHRAVCQFSLRGMLDRYYDLYVGLAAKEGIIPNAECHVRN